ncbi:hypothetical protein [Paenibacillus agilis]|uniref:Uncharacterized protein n=1 Tax=Paenibacillus agilis TaxID=3020863 RepID=A0A559IX94_9BACL|nr:hypothetical protein [Paenibacillus agilis]TVX92239.1 hypothetical protein FPZ44_03690 [Paenibacillus agilis]
MDNFDRTLELIMTTLPENKGIQEQLEKLEMKSQFRAPEMEGLNWFELAHSLKMLQVEELALVLATQADAIHFTKEEKKEIEVGLLKNRTMHYKIIGSSKTSDQDKTKSKEYLTHCKSAIMKVTDDPQFIHHIFEGNEEQ